MKATLRNHIVITPRSTEAAWRWKGEDLFRKNCEEDDILDLRGVQSVGTAMDVAVGDGMQGQHSLQMRLWTSPPWLRHRQHK